NRLKRRFWRSSNPHVEVAAIAVSRGHCKVRLIRFLAKATVTEVRHDGDDFEVWLGGGPGTLTNMRTERAATFEVSLGKDLVDDRRALARLAQRAGVAFVEFSPLHNSDPDGCVKAGADRMQAHLAIGRGPFARLYRLGF